MKLFRNIVFNEDCLIGLKGMPDQSVAVVVTDPPYFFDKMDDCWDAQKVAKNSGTGSVKSLPAGMKFGADQGKAFAKFYGPICEELFRVLKPGGFFLSFSCPRLYHRMAVAMEDTGFEIRDQIIWRHQGGQPKAFAQKHFINKCPKYSEARKAQLIAELDGWKTPQLMPGFESICMAQKPKEGTYVENWIQHRVGLMDVKQRFNGKFPGNVIEVPKPGMDEKGKWNDHPTVKPLVLIDHLIRLFTREGDLILDPFMGSGTTAVSAIRTGRDYVGFELDADYIKIIDRRINEANPVQAATTNIATCGTVVTSVSVAVASVNGSNILANQTQPGKTRRHGHAGSLPLNVSVKAGLSRNGGAKDGTPLAERSSIITGDRQASGAMVTPRKPQRIDILKRRGTRTES